MSISLVRVLSRTGASILAKASAVIAAPCISTTTARAVRLIRCGR
jgi:hypothetical protein